MFCENVNAESHFYLCFDKTEGLMVIERKRYIETCVRLYGLGIATGIALAMLISAFI
jgi:hypothetical protein